MPLGGRRVPVRLAWSSGVNEYAEADPADETTLETWASLESDGGATERAYSLTEVARAGQTRLLIRATSAVTPENFHARHGLTCRVRGLTRRVVGIEDPDGRRRHWRLTLAA